MCSYIFCRGSLVFDFQSTFKTYRSYPNIDERKKTPALRFLCSNWFLFEIYEAFDIEFEKSIWQSLDNADESAPTCFLYWLTIYMIKRNTYFIVLSIYLLINFVC